MKDDVSSGSAAILSASEVNDFLREVFPQIGIGRAFVVEKTARDFASMRMMFGDHLLRPGGTISGPSMFALADVALYAAVLASAGRIELAVTTNMTINFLRKPGAADMIGEARLLKSGKRLVYGDISLFSEGNPVIVAHATATYYLPQGKVL